MADDGAARCDYCGRRFPTERLRLLHLGSEHTQAVSDREWESAVDARAAEATELRRLRIRMLVALVVAYFGFLLLYATV